MPVAGLNNLQVSAFAGFKRFIIIHSVGNGGGVEACVEQAGAAGVPVGAKALKHTRDAFEFVVPVLLNKLLV